jgi:hypothetical protein
MSFLLIKRAALRWTDQSPQPTRQVHGTWPRAVTSHVDGVRRQRADWIESRLKDPTGNGSSAAMNMAWIVIFTSTMLRPLERNPAHQFVER